MQELPKLKRGRPTKAMQAKRARIEKENALSTAKTQEEREEIELSLLLDRAVYTARVTQLQADDETLKTIFTLSKLKATQGEIAAVLGVPRRTFGYFMDMHEIARETYEAGLAFYNMNLRRKQLQMAGKLAPMAIFLGKNDLGQKDIHEVKNATGKDAAATMSREDLLKVIKTGRNDSTAKDGGSSLQ